MGKTNTKDKKPAVPEYKGTDIKNCSITIGVLALQGAFREHIEAFSKIGIKAKEVRFPVHLEDIDGLVIPGGESTTIYRLMEKYGFKFPLRDFFRSRKPIFGTCAGLVLLAKKVVGEDFGYGFIDIVVDRNAYGRQVESFESSLDFIDKKSLDHDSFNAVFIRAPIIREAGRKVDVLGRLDGNIVLAKEKNILVCAFHPELTDDLRIHRYFVDMVKKNKNVKI